ncbi:type II CRISPR RNA-guided endonuclease Cas9 [Mycoplasmopsis cynos]|uniref:type II CRISPR RNA-guided endonuclease Cas9 n=1 Tax=Mycoplasmopsis cynos TaxID=171284 RepID=UPI002AFE9DB5|nr:type II CRISPR RNA-guided endonuclease Cas9 [Mycoplasmopsis cynos]WQQ14621.1 type II CRISPR RNA-guided endonuclease Cas9 [Mycoplasmopsis cynos]
MEEKRKVTLGFDLGVASVGWAIVDSETNEVYKLGSRLFDIPDTNIDRRAKRGSRRIVRRRSYRNQKFYNLIKRTKTFGFLDKEAIEKEFVLLSIKYPNIIELKVKGLQEEVSKSEAVWILHDYLKNRGYFYDDKEEKDDLENPSIESMPSYKLYEFYKEYGYFKGALSSPTESEKNKDSDLEKAIFFNFSNKEWTKEINHFFKIQKNIFSEDFKAKFMEFFSFIRDISKGPGSENMPSQYSIFGKYGDDGMGGKYQHIWDKNIGKCSIFKDKVRAPKYLPSALFFNLLNELSNIRLYSVDKREKSVLWRLSSKDKINIILNILQIILSKNDGKISNLDINKIVKNESIKSIILNEIDLDLIKDMWFEKEPNVYGIGLSGLNIEENKKENRFKFQDLKIFSVFIDLLKKSNINIEFNNEKDIINNLKLLDELYLFLITQKYSRDKYGSIKKFISNNKSFNIDNLDEKLNIFLSISDDEFDNHNSKTHSLSKEAIYFIFPKLLHNNEGWNLEAIKNYDIDVREEISKHSFGIKKQDKKYLDDAFLDDAILPPSVKVTIKQSILIFNKIIKKFSNKFQIDNVVIELAREMTQEKEMDAQKSLNRLKKSRNKIIEERLNANNIDSKMFRDKTGEILPNYIYKIYLWISQNFKDPYTGENISANDILKNNVEIDHIIPYSLCFDDSSSNKVLVFKHSNQSKGNFLPFDMISTFSENSVWNWKEYTQYVEKTFKTNLESILDKKERVKKADNLLISSYDGYDKLGFLARNLNDTRYATILFRDQLINYSENHLIDSKKMFKVIAMNGGVTSFIRKNMSFDSGLKVKDRSIFSHHAYDAAIIALFSNKTKILYNLIIPSLDGIISKRSEGYWVLEDRLTGEIRKLNYNDWQSIKNNVEVKKIAREIESHLSNLDNVVMFSRKSKRKTNKELYNETLYGIATRIDENGIKNYYKKEKFNILEDENIYLRLLNERENFIINRSNPEVIDAIIEIFETIDKNKIPARDVAKNIKYTDNKIKYNLYLKDYMRKLVDEFPDKFRKDFIEQMIAKKIFILFNPIKNTTRKIKSLRSINNNKIEDIRKKQVLEKFNTAKNEPRAFYESLNSLGAIIFKNNLNIYKKMSISSQIATFGDKNWKIDDINTYNKEKLNKYKEIYGIDETYDFYSFIFPGTILLDEKNKEFLYISSIQTLKDKIELKFLDRIEFEKKNVNSNLKPKIKREIISTKKLMSDYKIIKISPLGINKKIFE